MSAENPQHDPLIFFMRENGRLGLCLSYLGKWLLGIFSALVIAGTLGFFGLVYAAERNSHLSLVEIKQMRSEFSEYKTTTDKRFDRIEGRMDQDDLDDRRQHRGKGST